MKLAILIASICLVSSAWADIGIVTELTGSASIKRGRETILVAKGTVIEQNDRVETKNGKVKIVFKDDTKVDITEHSSLIIDDFVYDPSSGKGKLGMKAASGTVRYVSGAIAKDPKSVNIKTPTASIAVRGTDFVMSVNETGSSMVILMPSCEANAIAGTSCSSGKIDVESGPNRISMDKPYQATMVESAGQPPTPPVIVNLSGTQIGNNLHISPPKTTSGSHVVAAARAAAERTGDLRRDAKENKNDHNDQEKQKVAHKQSEERNITTEHQETTTKVKIEIDTSKLNIPVSNATTGNPNVKKIHKDASETLHVGWQYESLSHNGNNYVSIVQSLDSKALVIVTQDRITDAHNFNPQSTKAYGLIVINQSHR